MRLKLLSFDLQGTLSAAAWSDEFWLELLPRLYAEHYDCAPEEAKAILRAEFKKIGRYDARYYDAGHWLQAIGETRPLKILFRELSTMPRVYAAWLPLLRELSRQVPLLVMSATTHDFIDCEIGRAARYFQARYSALEDFGCPGKTPELYRRLAAKHGVAPGEALHIGDDPLFDVAAPRAAGMQAQLFSAQSDIDEQISALRENICRVYA